MRLNSPLSFPGEANTSRFVCERVYWCLCVYIGLSLFPVQESDAMSHVAGYTVAHDVTARDWQMKKNGKQWLLGKTFDTFCPLGPAIVTPSSLSGIHLCPPLMCW